MRNLLESHAQIFSFPLKITDLWCKTLQETPQPKKRGPKPYAPKKAERDDVALFMASGMSEPRIAAVLGICQNTLRKHFATELQIGRDREMAANLKRLRKAAAKGNVTAMKHLDAKYGTVSTEHSFAAPEAQPDRPEKLGKKEQAMREASTAGQGTTWGQDLEPKNTLN